MQYFRYWQKYIRKDRKYACITFPGTEDLLQLQSPFTEPQLAWKTCNFAPQNYWICEKIEWIDAYTARQVS